MIDNEKRESLKQIVGDLILKDRYAHQEWTVEVNSAHLFPLLSFLKSSPEGGYVVLMDLTAVDYLYPEKQTKVIYWLHHPQTFQRIRVICYVKRGESLPSVTPLWEGADWYEREVFDLFGIQFEDHPDLKRILMPDHWKGHPLCRDYALTEESVQFKHGVCPKIPSEILHIRKNQKYPT